MAQRRGRGHTGQATADPLPTPPSKLKREEYRRWAKGQPSGRSELVAGEVIATAAERISRAQVKASAWLALRRAIEASGVACQAFSDGVTIEVDDDTDYEPDALVNCGDEPDGNAVAAPNPVVVVEVLSPGTRSVDTGAKLTGYFRVPSVQHYLILVTDRWLVVHHRRGDDDGIATRVVASGRIALDPPGIAVTVGDLFTA